MKSFGSQLGCTLKFTLAPREGKRERQPYVDTRPTSRCRRQVPLNDHVIKLGPYTILTVDEGYAAVTQNNGKQMVLGGGAAHFLNHKNWKVSALHSR